MRRENTYTHLEVPSTSICTGEDTGSISISLSVEDSLDCFSFVTAFTRSGTFFLFTVIRFDLLLLFFLRPGGLLGKDFDLLEPESPCDCSIIIVL